MDAFDRFNEWAGARFGLSAEVLGRVFTTAAILLFYVVAVRVARRVAAKTVDHAASRYQINKATGYLFGFLAFAVLVKVWLQGFAGLATYLGLLSAGVALALQDPIINLAGWLFIVARRPF